MSKKQTKLEETKERSRPVHSIKVGPVTGSVFLNKTESGETFPSAIITRTYKAGSEFKRSNSYGAKHLENLAAIVANLQAWIKQNYPQAAS